MTIDLVSAGRRFNREWIFKGLSCKFEAGTATAVLGGNGSGKSTLLKIISGALSLSEGMISYYQTGNKIDPNGIYKHVSIAAPYLSLFDYFSFPEIIEFQLKFKPCLLQGGVKEIIECSGLNTGNKLLKYFSSGMMQRVRLTLAITSGTPILLLDEPLSNLDAGSVLWYKALLEKYSSGRNVIVFSNNLKEEYFLCRNFLELK